MIGIILSVVVPLLEPMPYLSSERMAEIDSFVRKQVSFPKREFAVKISGLCGDGVKGTYSFSTDTVCFDGFDEEIFAHEVAHAYGMDEEWAEEVAWEWIKQKKRE